MQLDAELRQLLRQAISNKKRERVPYTGNEDTYHRYGRRDLPDRVIHRPLTASELEIEELDRQGLTVAEIAHKRGVKEQSVRVYLTDIRAKRRALAVSTDTDLHLQADGGCPASAKPFPWGPLASWEGGNGGEGFEAGQPAVNSVYWRPFFEGGDDVA
jgi:hypothetical protein